MQGRQLNAGPSGQRRTVCSVQGRLLSAGPPPAQRMADNSRKGRLPKARLSQNRQLNEVPSARRRIQGPSAQCTARPHNGSMLRRLPKCRAVSSVQGPSAQCRAVSSMQGP